MEDRSHCDRKSGVTGIAVMPRLILHLGSLDGFAVWASRNSFPPSQFQMLNASLLRRELLVDLNDVHGVIL